MTSKEQNQRALVDAILQATKPEKSGTFCWDGGGWLTRTLKGTELSALALTGDHGTPDALVIPLSNSRAYCCLGIRVTSLTDLSIEVPSTAQSMTLGGLDFEGNMTEAGEKIVATLAVLNIIGVR